MNREKSRQIFEKALTLIPGGVNSPARAFGGVGGAPVVIDRAEGPFLFDVDGNRYIDYVLSWGPMILGHADPRVVEALKLSVDKGTSFGAPTQAENDLAELVVKLVPSMEKVRLVNSGTEATMSAIRLARGYTGRDKIVKFIGCYHGHVDSLLVAAGSAAATLSVPNSPGVTSGTAADTILLQYNDVDAVRQTFAERGSEIAGVIVEPVAGNMGCVPGKPEFLQALREETKKAGALLIFDEVMCGFRVAKGGAQEVYGIDPDLTTLGKVIGGGLPVGAYGGKAEFMNAVIPCGKVFQAGTLSGNPLATAAGIATLKALDEDAEFYAKIERTTARLADGLSQAANAAGVKVSVQRCGGMATLFFLGDEDDAVVDWPSASRCDTQKFAKFFWKLLDGGVYLPCSQFEAMFTSVAHSDELIDRTIDVAADAFRSL
ncbi:MAG: glutamate-1-semialdehyde 2,1-aminomutase [Thermoguttaceae bacterium]|nr:glutamate-1-semialdehyde 2,1-aminomutase [Thermoguttaceae bacterium]